MLNHTNIKIISQCAEASIKYDLIFFRYLLLFGQMHPHLAIFTHLWSCLTSFTHILLYLLILYYPIYYSRLTHAVSSLQ